MFFKKPYTLVKIACNIYLPLSAYCGFILRTGRKTQAFKKKTRLKITSVFETSHTVTASCSQWLVVHSCSCAMDMLCNRWLVYTTVNQRPCTAVTVQPDIPFIRNSSYVIYMPNKWLYFFFAHHELFTEVHLHQNMLRYDCKVENKRI